MKTWIKRLIGLFLMFALLVTMIPVTTTYAATPKITLYLGESMCMSVPGILVGKINSSKKAIVSVKKEKKYQDRITMIPKKEGTTTLTINYKNFYFQTVTLKIKVTVRKANLTVNLIRDVYGLNYSISNNTNQTFESAKITRVLRDSDGNILQEDVADIYDVIPAGKTIYPFFFYDCDKNDIDIEKSSLSINYLYHNPKSKYVDTSDSVEWSIQEENGTDQYGFKQRELKLQYMNTYDKSVNGVIYVLLYDADNELIRIQPFFINDSASKDSKEHSLMMREGEEVYKRYDHYEVYVCTYSIE